MTSNLSFVVTFLAMITTIIVLQGCTKFDKQDRAINRWHVSMVSNETECRVDVGQDKEDFSDDDSVEFEQPNGGN